ncbi:MAG: hypothetical protein PHC89_00760 [Candidatus Pacebacteria bacterium]|nr:hypothetical protein [Candidatus Paceibacterota bacterium]
MKKISINNIFRRSWDTFTQDWKIFLSAGLIISIVAFLTELKFDSSSFYTASEFFIKLIGGLLSVFLSLGLIRMILNRIRGKKIALRNLFENISLKLYFSFLIVGIVYAIIIGFGFIALIIPGLILMSGLYMTQYLVADEKAKVMESFSKSWKLTKGNRWRIFFFLILIGIISIIGALTLVGMIVVIPFISIASTYLYNDIVSGGEVRAHEEVTSEDKEGENE